MLTSLLPYKIRLSGTVGTPGTTLTWDNIQTLLSTSARHFGIIITGKNTTAGRLRCRVHLNNDTTSGNYMRSILTGEDTTLATAINTDTSGFGIDTTGTGDTAYGAALILFPWAFRTDRFKSFMSTTVSGATRLSHIYNIRFNTEAVSRLDLVSFAGNWAVGTRWHLVEVDELALLDQHILTEDATLAVNNIPGYEHLITLLSGRTDRVGTDGDRITNTLNGDDDDFNYFIQRLAAEIPQIQDELDTLRTNAWVPSAGHAAGDFGMSMVFHPELHSSTKHKTYYLYDGNNDTPYDPSQFHNARWINSDPITSFLYDAGNGTNVAQGSIFEYYRTRRPFHVFRVGPGGAESVTLPLPQVEGMCSVMLNARSNSISDFDTCLMALNDNITGSAYRRQRMTARQSEHVADKADARDIISVPGDGAAALAFGGGVLTLFEPAMTDRWKTYIYTGGAAEEQTMISGGRFESNNPLSTLTLAPSDGTLFKEGSLFVVYNPFQDVLRGGGRTLGLGLGLGL